MRSPVGAAPASAPPAVALTRVLVGAAVIAILLLTYGLARAGGEASPIDFFGYFTNLTSLLAAIILILTGTAGLARRPAPPWLTLCRAVATSCLIIVAVVYNVLVPGTGSAPPWVSVVLHGAFPAIALLDWLFVGDRPRLPWSRLWVVLPYPLLWLAVTLVRGATDGWVPYGFLLPERGATSLALHVSGLLAALLVAGSAVWGASRLPGLSAERAHPADAAPAPSP
ncbi:Pr6Pr family membrane protein [Mycetocola reblochoni]|uniref:Integral membrane protein n=2 Tax=Mycetocola reblochoni TaxID=331618 RepID=A0A1R4IUT6_9MICO|nr:Pr6Pr family membrane protein [Mycetocola reblochoni]RLP71058.1 hypothetical protein D9V30_01130 [Mycetocola reblochoni]SJN23083.1 Integral membrane protein [Mycetocola reblochoni REB411]